MFETFSKNPVPVFVSFFFAAISLGSAKKKHHRELALWFSVQVHSARKTDLQHYVT